MTIGAPAGLAIGAVLAIVGLPPVDLHGPTHYMRIMDPLCGMTRGSVALLQGHVTEALRYNPASPLVLLAGVAGVARGLLGAWRDRWLAVQVRWTPGVVVAVGLPLLALEVRQQLNVDRLTG